MCFRQGETHCKKPYNSLCFGRILKPKRGNCVALRSRLFIA
jgi:hypothetical protein